MKFRDFLLPTEKYKTFYTVVFPHSNDAMLDRRFHIQPLQLLCDRKRVAPEVRQIEVEQELPTVRVGIGAHATVACGRQCCELLDQPAIRVKQLVWPIAAHPGFE